MSRASGANEHSENDYVPNAYFQGWRAERSVEHCIGNSCDNLVAMDPKPASGSARTLVPEAHLPHALCATVVSKPPRSDLNEEEDKAVTVGTTQSHAITEPGARVFASSMEAMEAFQQSDYYAELRRRSLEGRAPVSFGPDGAFTNPLQDSLASDEFDAALY